MLRIHAYCISPARTKLRKWWNISFLWIEMMICLEHTLNNILAGLYKEYLYLYSCMIYACCFHPLITVAYGQTSFIYFILYIDFKAGFRRGQFRFKVAFIHHQMLEPKFQCEGINIHVVWPCLINVQANPDGTYYQNPYIHYPMLLDTVRWGVMVSAVWWHLIPFSMFHAIQLLTMGNLICKLTILSQWRTMISWDRLEGFMAHRTA